MTIAPADDLVAFLRARLDEDEAVAQAAGHGCGYLHDHNAGWVEVALPHEHNARPTYEVHHIARHDPARVLREVAAKRAVMEAAEEASGLDAQVDGEFRVGRRDYAAEPFIGDVILRHLAAVYDSHPDYREEWRP